MWITNSRSPWLPWFSPCAVIFGNCRDSVSRPWLSPKYVQFRLLNGQFCVNICGAFLSWARIVAWLTLLPCRECIYRTMASCSARLHSSFLDQTQIQRMWPQACSYSQPHPITQEKASSVVSQSIRPNSSVGAGHVNKIVMHKLQTTVYAWVGYGSKLQMAWQPKRSSNVSATYVGWIECRLTGGWIPVKKLSHMTDKRPQHIKVLSKVA